MTISDNLLNGIAEVILDKLIKSEPYTLILSEVLDVFKANENMITDNEITKIVDKNLAMVHPSEVVTSKLITFE